MMFKILWVDDDDHVLEAARRLFREHPWELITVQSQSSARDIIEREDIAVIIADQNLGPSSGVDLLEEVRHRSPSTTRILVTGAIDSSVLVESVNRCHLFRFITKPWENAIVVENVEKAIQYHQLKITQTSLLKEVSLQNRELERLTLGLEQLVTERTLTAQESKNQIEKKVSRLRDLVRFIKDLSLLTSIEDLMGLMRKELKGVHELRPLILGYLESDRSGKILFFQGKQVVEHSVRQLWSTNSRIRINEYDDQVYLANEFGRPVGKVIAIPLNRRGLNGKVESEAPATIFFEHVLADDKVDGFLDFISERLQPLAIAIDRILLEYHLKFTSLQWESTFDGIHDPIAIIDIDYEVIRANRHFVTHGERSLNKSCHQLLNQSASVCRGCPVKSALTTGVPQRGQIRCGHRLYEVQSYPIHLRSDGISTNVINHYVDVTRSKELHGRMIQSEKMAAIGLLAGNIAHELNNPLTGIRSLAQVLISSIPEGQQLRDDLLEVEKAADRSQKIIENLLDFSKGDTDQKQVVISLNELVERTLPMLKTAMREHRSQVYLGHDKMDVKVEPHLMQQVIFNLVNNACQAMQSPGTISIETELIDEEKVKWAGLRIRDSGPGIPQDLLDSIFEPFFTTKKEGEGTGLGLSMSRSVIQNFGGDIYVESQIGEGSVFTVRLPVL